MEHIVDPCLEYAGTMTTMTTLLGVTFVLGSGTDFYGGVCLKRLKFKARAVSAASVRISLQKLSGLWIS